MSHFRLRPAGYEEEEKKKKHKNSVKSLVISWIENGIYPEMTIGELVKLADKRLNEIDEEMDRF